MWVGKSRLITNWRTLPYKIHLLISLNKLSVIERFSESSATDAFHVYYAFHVLLRWLSENKRYRSARMSLIHAQYKMYNSPNRNYMCKRHIFSLSLSLSLPLSFSASYFLCLSISIYILFIYLFIYLFHNANAKVIILFSSRIVMNHILH